jgi:hypothetical protein
LAVRFGHERRGPDIGYPDLYGSEALSAESIAMSLNPLTCGGTLSSGHTPMLHVTQVAADHVFRVTSMSVLFATAIDA